MIQKGDVVRLKEGILWEVASGKSCYEGQHLPVEQGTMALVVFVGPCDCGKCAGKRRYKVLAEGRMLYAQRYNFRLMGSQWSQ